MSLELKKRIFTSVVLLCLLTMMFFFKFVLIISLIIIAIVCWVEFYALISKIFLRNNRADQLLRFSLKGMSLFYLSFLVSLIIIQSKNPELNLVVIYAILISIMTDVGGLIVGKIFKGKKLTKISPNKTISGSIGSFTFSLLLIPFSIKYFVDYSFLQLFIFTILVSLISQMGDLLISFLKRKARVKNTSDLLPGHGGVLDRIDGIIFAIPTAIFLVMNF